MARKNLAAMDTHRTNGARRALAGRYDSSRRVPFDAELDKLSPNPFNPRYPDDPEVQEMAASLAEVGQLQIATVVTREAFIEAYPEADDKIADHAVWVVYMGNRRLAAAALAGWKTLNVILAENVASAEAIADAIIHENLHRKGLPPLLLADAYRQKMDRENLTARQLAGKVGKSHAHINDHLALLRLAAPWQQLITTGELDLSDAKRIARADADLQSQLFEQHGKVLALAPAARDLAYRGELSSDEISYLAELPHKIQRDHVAALKDSVTPDQVGSGNSVSTNRELTSRPKVAAGEGGEASAGRAPAEATRGDAPQWTFPPTVHVLAEEIRKHLTEDEVAALVAELTGTKHR